MKVPDYAASYNPNIDGSEGSKRSQQYIPRKSTFSKKQPTRIETTGEKQSQAQIDKLLQSQEQDMLLVGSVNIQTDAISFDKHGSSNQASYNKQKSQVSNKSKTSFLSQQAKNKGVVNLPTSLAQSKKDEIKTKTGTADALNVTDGSHAQPEQINRLIQRDLLARKDVEAGVPYPRPNSSTAGHDSVSTPHLALQKQSTDVFPDINASTDMPKFRQSEFQRKNRGRQAKDKTGAENDQIDKNAQIQIIENEFAGSKNTNSPESQALNQIMIKQSEKSARVDIRSIASIGSNKSFKIHDSKTIIEVEAQIQILDASKQIPGATSPEPSPVDKVTTKLPNQVTGKPPVLVHQYPKQDTASSQSSYGAIKQQKPSGGAKSFIPPPSKSKLLSSRAQRGAMSEKDLQEEFDRKTDSPLGSQDFSNNQQINDAIKKESGLKSVRGGLLKIDEEQPQQKLQQPNIKIQPLDLTTPRVTKVVDEGSSSIAGSKRKKSGKNVEELSDKVTEVTVSRYNDEAYEVISRAPRGASIKKSAKKVKGKTDKEKKEKQPASPEEIWKPEQRMKGAMYAREFFTNMYDGFQTGPAGTGSDLGDEFARDDAQPLRRSKGQKQTADLQIPSGPNQSTNNGNSNGQQPQFEGQDRVANLEDEVAKLRDVIKQQKTMQDQMRQYMTAQTQPQLQQSPTIRERRSLVNKGSIGTLHQPVYNLNFYNQMPQSMSEADDFQSDLIRDEHRQINRSGRPNSSNVNHHPMMSPTSANTEKNYAAKGPAPSRKKRPMTAAGVGAKRPQPPQHLYSEPEANMQLQPSSIHFELSSRPISAATMQKRPGSRHKTDGYISEYRYQPQSKLDKHLNHVKVPEARDHMLNKKHSEIVKEHIAVRELLQAADSGKLFHPQTNFGNERGIKQTQSCYLNVLGQTGQDIQPYGNEGQQFMHSNASRTGYASFPNKSQKILEKTAIVEPSTLSRPLPFGLANEPISQLQGPIHKEMVYFDKQKNGRKLSYNNRSGTNRSDASRHTKLMRQSGLASQQKNEDLFFTNIDDYIKHNMVSQMKQGGQHDNNDTSLDSCDDTTPGLTGNDHIIMVRDNALNTYTLTQGDNQIELGSTHFQPVFFAKNTQDLRDNSLAQNALKQFRSFPCPNRMYEQLNEMKIKKEYESGNLEQLIQVQQETDWKKHQIYKTQKKQATYNDASHYNRQNDMHETGEIAINGTAPSGGTMQRQQNVRTTEKQNASDKKKKKRMMLYRMQGMGTQSFCMNMLDKPMATNLGSGTSNQNQLSQISGNKRNVTRRRSLKQISEIELKKKESVQPQLSEHQKALFQRLAQNKEPKSRKTSFFGNQADLTSDGNSPMTPSYLGKRQQSKNNSFVKSITVRDSEKTKTPPVSPFLRQSSPPQIATTKQRMSTKVKPSFSGNNETDFSPKNLGPRSVSTGGGTYPLHQQLRTQKETSQTAVVAKRPAEGLKKCQTPTAAQLQQTQQQRKSELQQAPAQRKANQTNVNKATSSSDKYTNKSISQKAGTITGTDRPSDGTKSHQAVTKNIDSKYSHSQTCVESETTDKTQIVKRPQKIKDQQQKVQPSLTSRIAESDSGGNNSEDEAELELKKNDMSDSGTLMPTKPDIIFLTGDDRGPESSHKIQISLLPLDSTQVINSPVMSFDQNIVCEEEKEEEEGKTIESSAQRNTFGLDASIKLNFKDTDVLNDKSRQNLIEDTESISSIEDNVQKQEMKPASLSQLVARGHSDTASTPDLGQKSSDNTNRIPKLMINALELPGTVQRRESMEQKLPSDQNFLNLVDKIEPSKRNPNTDRNMRQETLSPDSSRDNKQELLDLPDPAFSYSRKARKTKDSQHSSIRTPMWKDQKQKTGGSPSAQSASDFSFAMDLNRNRPKTGNFVNKNEEWSRQGSGQEFINLVNELVDDELVDDELLDDQSSIDSQRVPKIFQVNDEKETQ